MYIIIHGEEQDRKRLKGKTITEFARNMQNEGWPTEVTPEERDRIKYAERRTGHSLKIKDAIRIKCDMDVDKRRDIIEKVKKQRLTYYKNGYPK